METTTGKQGTWIKLADLVVGDELNDGSTVTSISRRTEKSARITVVFKTSTQTIPETSTYRGRNVLVVR